MAQCYAMDCNPGSSPIYFCAVPDYHPDSGGSKPPRMPRSECCVSPRLPSVPLALYAPCCHSHGSSKKLPDPTPTHVPILYCCPPPTPPKPKTPEPMPMALVPLSSPPCPQPPPPCAVYCCTPPPPPKTKTKYVMPCYRYEDGRIENQLTSLSVQACKMSGACCPEPPVPLPPIMFTEYHRDLLRDNQSGPFNKGKMNPVGKAKKQETTNGCRGHDPCIQQYCCVHLERQY